MGYGIWYLRQPSALNGVAEMGESRPTISISEPAQSPKELCANNKFGRCSARLEKAMRDAAKE